MPRYNRLELRCIGRITEARMIRLDQDLDLLIGLADRQGKSAQNQRRRPRSGRS